MDLETFDDFIITKSGKTGGNMIDGRRGLKGCSGEKDSDVYVHLNAFWWYTKEHWSLHFFEDKTRAWSLESGKFKDKTESLYKYHVGPRSKGVNNTGKEFPKS